MTIEKLECNDYYNTNGNMDILKAISLVSYKINELIYAVNKSESMDDSKSEVEIKGCPWCGHTPWVEENKYNEVSIECTNNTCVTNSTARWDKLAVKVKAWNKRA